MAGPETAMRLIVATENLQHPLDEGAKKTAAALIDHLRTYASILVATRSEYHLPGVEVLQLPRNKLLLDSAFARQLRDYSAHALIYLPSSAVTFGGFVRCAVLKACAGGVRTALVSLQPRRHQAWLRFIKLKALAADIVIAQSLESVQLLSQIGWRAHWLPGGVDLQVFCPVSEQRKRELRRQYGFGEDDKILLHVGHIKPRRNVAVLGQLRAGGYRTVVVGSTSTEPDLDLLRRLQSKQVRVISDYVERIEEYYQLADGYVFPVTDEISAIEVPLSVLEAMACNLPVVSTPFGGLPAMFSAGGGLYFRHGDDDWEALVAVALKTNDCRTRELVAPYSWSAMAARLVDLLRPV